MLFSCHFDFISINVTLYLETLFLVYEIIFHNYDIVIYNFSRI